MDFGTLKARALELLGRNAVELAYELATTDLNDTLRIRGMENTVTIASSGGSIALPDDFIEAQRVRNVGGGFLNPISHERIVAQSATGCPTHYVVEADALTLNPAPEDGHEIEVVYFAKLAPLSVGADTNAALIAALPTYVYTALAHHARLIRDTAALQLWQAEAAKAVTLANSADIKSRFNGGSLEVEPVGEVV